MLKHTQIYLLLLVGVAIYFTGCKAEGDYTGREYMPDMVHSQAYEYYSPSRDIISPEGDTIRLSATGQSARLPVKGTIPQGYTPYPFADTPEDYERAGVELFNPMNAQHSGVLGDGKALYATNCAICHGDKGDGQGEIVKSGKYPGGPPSYFIDRLLEMPEGKMFHSIQYGKNNMGSYAGQMSKEERWKVVSYIKDLQAAHIASNKKLTKNEALALITGRLTYKDAATYSSKGAVPAAAATTTATADSTASNTTTTTTTKVEGVTTTTTTTTKSTVKKTK
jgi:mono/diheme cytochrome c family protein